MQQVELLTFEMLEAMTADSVSPEDMGRLDRALLRLTGDKSEAGLMRVEKDGTKLAVVWYTCTEGTALTCCRKLRDTLQSCGFDAVDPFLGRYSRQAWCACRACRSYLIPNLTKTIMARIKTQKTGIETEAEFFAKVDTAATLSVEIRRLEADRDKDLQEVRERAEVAIKAKKELLAGISDACAAYATENRAALFEAGKKSAATTLARFGFNFPAPSLVLASSKRRNWAGVAEYIREKYPRLARFWLIWKEPEVNKSAIKAAHLRPANLSKLGLKLQQKETFFIEPKDNGTQSEQ